MKPHLLSAYLLAKYGQISSYKNIEGEPDTSFGVAINAAKTRILKDKLILVYDKINKDITQLPAFKQINEELSDEFYFNVFLDLINNFVVNIEDNSLKDAFSYSVRMIEALNQLRNALIKNKMEREKMIDLDTAIRSVQDTIWKESKRILNIHDLKGLILSFPELKDKINAIVPTWDYGPGKNPAAGKIRQRRRETVKDLIKRIQGDDDK